MFQFLIGSLKTLSTELIGSLGSPFQFLIGSLKTIDTMVKRGGRSSFNSL